MIRKIAEGPIDEGWIRALAELEKRSKAVEAKQKEPQQFKALDDLKPLMDNLNNKVCFALMDK